MAAILIIEDEHALGNALALAVRRLGHLPTLAASGAAAFQRLKEQSFEAIVLDIGLPDINGLEVLKKIRESGSMVPVLILSAHATLDHTILSQKLGIADFLIKPLDLERFEEVISSLVTKSVVIAEPNTPVTTSLLGAAPSMHRVFLGIARACRGDMPVLIHGDSGTGKTLAARLIHTHSLLSTKQLRVLDGSTLNHQESLLSHLHDANGTLILENIDRLPPPLQQALAEIIAASDRKLPRLIATMQENPRQEERPSSLRTDLFYAFGTLSIAMPPLRDRSGDIPALSRFFYGLHENAAAAFEISASALCALQAYQWPGNVRELRHVIEHALAMSRGAVIMPGHLPPHVAEALQKSRGTQISGELGAVLARWVDSQLESSPESAWQYDELLDQVDGAILRHLLARFENRPTRLAAALRMNRATLRQKMRRAGLGGDQEDRAK